MTERHALPIDARLGDVRRALAAHSRVLLMAEPGAGKTTRVPLALLDEPWCGAGKLLLLEPRRVAARLAARYMAEQRGEAVGETIGYRVRGESRVGSSTRLEVITQGMLTRMLQDDPMLEGVAGIVFDEFHERSLEADLGLSLALDVQQGLREELRLLIMSATLDVEVLRGVLGEEAPLVECQGRVYPVETHYRPISNRQPVDAQQACVVREALSRDTGDVLVFLPGVAEIRRLSRALSGLTDQTVIHELHGRLPLDAQQRALRPDPQGRRRVVLATAIAESSITVDGVHSVIDTGFERVSSYRARSGMCRLVTRRINRASADQRRGRAGRQAPGVCYRLWAEEQPLPAHGDPEIVQADLTGLAFELARWGIKDRHELSWVTPPPAAALSAGRDLLQRLGVLDERFNLTALGRACARWPTHPRLAVLLERADAWRARPLACWLAALLEGRDMGEGCDLAQHLTPLLAGQMNNADEKNAVRSVQWRHDARRLAELASCSLTVDSLVPLGELLALAYPERIGKRIEPGRFKLAGGGQASLDLRQPLAHAEHLVAVDLDGKPDNARIFHAAELSPGSLDALFPDTRHWQARLEWDEREGRLRGEEVRSLGELVLERRPLTQLPDDAVQQALLDALRKGNDLPLDEEAEQVLGRIALLHRLFGEPWPDWSQSTLLASLEAWLSPYLVGLSRLDEVRRLPWARILKDRLEWAQGKILEELAPSHISVPSGSRIRVDYRGEVPVLAVKLQELFGLRETPTVAEGRVPVMLHLLSPARRPLQMTRDLASFWSKGYAEVRKDMRGRYPKHPWPEDPLVAPATAGTKNRK